MNVAFYAITGHHPGGEGYDQFALPTCNIRTTTGVGGKVSAVSTLGYGGSFTYTTESLGIIKALRIISEGTGYTTPPILDFSRIGDGKAKATTSVVTGIYSYPGRYLNDDGQLSAQNFLQDRDYYQNFSYVIRSDQPISKYRKTLQNLTHPAGAKMFGQYEADDVSLAEITNIHVGDSSHFVDLVKSGLIFYLNSANTETTNTTHITSSVNPSYAGEFINGAQVRSGILQFDGTNDFVRYPNTTALDLQNMTIEVWTSVPTTFQDSVLFQKGANGTQYYLGFNLRGDLTFSANVNGTFTSTAIAGPKPTILLYQR